jgi:hypothetical protein
VCLEVLLHSQPSGGPEIKETFNTYQNFDSELLFFWFVFT